MTDRMARRAPRRAITCPACGLPEAVCTHRAHDDAERYYRCRVCGHRWALQWTVTAPVAASRREAAPASQALAPDAQGGER